MSAIRSSEAEPRRRRFGIGQLVFFFDENLLT
jgi:hypothetical protein